MHLVTNNVSVEELQLFIRLWDNDFCCFINLRPVPLLIVITAWKKKVFLLLHGKVVLFYLFNIIFRPNESGDFDA